MRTTFSALIATVVTLLLFLAMRGLISGPDAVAATPATPPVVDVVDAPPEPDETPPPEEELVEPEPPPKGIETVDVVVTTVPPVDPTTPQRPTDATGQLFGLQAASTGSADPVPEIAIPPQYPRKLLLDGTEGWVRIAFTIEADGSVSGASVVDASPRRGLFDDAALGAIRHWRFVPKRDADGRPVSSRAKYTIRFTIDSV